MSAALETLEAHYGVHTCWGWTKEWVENEAECDEDERITLEEYLWLRAENEDEVAAGEAAEEADKARKAK